jgi:hypothetical protein
LVEPQNQGRAGTTWEPSHEWRLAEATPSSRGLQWFSRKPLGYSVQPQNRGRRLDQGVRPPRPVQPPRRGGQTAWGRSDLPGRSNRPRGRSDRPGRRRRDASKRRTHVGIARLASRLSRVRSRGHPSDEEISKTSKSAPEGHVSLVISEGSLVFWVPPYILIEWVDGS